ncbi:MAG: hypothetical protein F9K34_17630, partial [Albidovulum sp.]|uniref:argininosuccinate synthase domain-containing protein n=1 Tax=Albidovulum sp. TaxID=1872424 RepID=UPI001326495B
SVIVPWLKEHYDAKVVCVAADVGQGEDELRGVKEKAIASGAVGGFQCPGPCAMPRGLRPPSGRWAHSHPPG